MTHSLSPQKVRYIIVHCSATPLRRDIGVSEIRRWHRSQGWNDIGYHYVVRLDGTIEAGRSTTLPGAHCKGLNHCSIGVCYVGGVLEDFKTPADTRTPRQKEALLKLIAQLLIRFPNAEVRSHHDFAAKACPCFDATAEYGHLINQRVL